MAKPILKWAGGKTQLLPEIQKNLPAYIQQGERYRYIEPFSGSAAVAFYLLDTANPPEEVIINDINTDLINLYQVVKHHPDALLSLLKQIQTEYDELINKEDKKPYFYEKRKDFNTRDNSDITQAALFIFLNRAGFNGLYRVNSKNEFNVPIGSYKSPKFVFEDLILHISKLLENVTITNQPFEQLLKHLDESSAVQLPTFIYLDPPYRPISASSSFTSYAKDSFNDDDQKRLKIYCDQINAMGHQWLLSNSDPKNSNIEDNFFDDLYADYRIERVQAGRSINSNASKRGKITELMIRNY